MRARILQFALASLCLVLFPAAAFADGVMIGPCGNSNIVGNANPTLICVLPGGGVAVQGGQAISGVNSFRNNHSPVIVAGFSGQTNTFVQTIVSNPIWTVPGPVLTRLALNGTVLILEEGATVDITFTGLLGGPALVIQQHFANSANVSIEVFGMQAINALATSTLSITIHGAGAFVAPGSGEFEGAIPEPATLLLLGTGLTGVAMKLRKKRGVDKSQAP
ncbi:MAG TPA: PEP-CTERM sorting domain-containing protein [Pyrinomonadaceae bacterium]|nr:PEP-CTERM sorting domain-containing protein [Pyrinomonadaceae bacterium]